jgi:hypothetical protein
MHLFHANFVVKIFLWEKSMHMRLVLEINVYQVTHFFYLKNICQRQQIAIPLQPVNQLQFLVLSFNRYIKQYRIFPMIKQLVLILLYRNIGMVQLPKIWLAIMLILDQKNTSLLQIIFTRHYQIKLFELNEFTIDVSIDDIFLY